MIPDQTKSVISLGDRRAEKARQERIVRAARILERHKPAGGEGPPTDQRCRACGESWPCEVGTVAAELGRLVEVVQQTEADARLAGVLRRTVAWARRTFPHASPQTIVAHLRREVERELVPAPTSAEEIADCVMLLAHLADHAGADLADAVERKLAVCEARTWAPPDAEGVSEHARGNELPGVVRRLFGRRQER